MGEGQSKGVTAPNAPIIVTATMGDEDFRWADGLRRAHYPPGRNLAPAHITLFRHLPPSLQPELCDRLARLCAGPPPVATLAAVLRLGDGVAYRIDSAELNAMRRDLADAFHGLLTPQDEGPPRLHVTVQNKASAETSRALYRALQGEFRPRPFAIAGLAAWRYLGGPWEPIRAYRFRGR